MLIVIIALAITVVPVFAQSPTPTPTDTAPTIALPGTFTGFLQLLGSAIFIGPAISILAKKWTWFQGLSKSAKFGMVFAICMILPLGSHALLTYLSPGVIAVMKSWWPYVLVGFGVFTGTQIWWEVFGDNTAPASITSFSSSLTTIEFAPKTINPTSNKPVEPSVTIQNP